MKVSPDNHGAPTAQGDLYQIESIPSALPKELTGPIDSHFRRLSAEIDRRFVGIDDCDDAALEQQAVIYHVNTVLHFEIFEGSDDLI